MPIFGVIMNAVSRFFAGEKPSSIKSLYYVELGNSRLDKGRVDDSIDLFKKAIECDTKNFYAYVSMAAAYMENRMFEQVIHCCNRAIETKQDVFCHIIKEIERLCIMNLPTDMLIWKNMKKQKGVAMKQ